MSTYYVADVAGGGSDSNSGLSELLPWLTVAKVNGSTFSPGDSILFKKGCTWREQLTVPSSGSAGNPITFGKYGTTGGDPIIDASDLITPGTSWTVVPGVPAEAEVQDTSDTSQPIRDGAYWSYPAQGFASDGAITVPYVDLYLAKVSTPTGNIWAEIWDTAGTPARYHAVVGTSANVDVSTLGSAAYVRFTFSPSISISAATPYILAVTGDWTIDGAKYVNWYLRNAEVYRGGDPYRIQIYDASRVYENGFDVDHRFKIYKDTAGGTIWTATVTTEPKAVFFDGVKGTHVANQAACTGTGKWFWAVNALSVYSATDPDTAYTSPGIEVSSRDSCIYVSNSHSYVTFDELHVRRANGQYGAGFKIEAPTCTIQNCEADDNVMDGIVLRDLAADTMVAGCSLHDNGPWISGTDQMAGIKIYKDAASSGHEDRIIGNEIYDNHMFGVYLWSNYCITEKNYVHGNGTTDVATIGIEVFNGGDDGYGANNTIRYNLVTGQISGGDNGEGIDCDDLSDSNIVHGNVCYGNDGPGFTNWRSTNNSFYNNTSYGNCLNSGGALTSKYELHVGASAPGEVSGLSIKNNIAQATEANTYAIGLDANTYNSTGLSITNNVWYAAATNWYFWNATGGNNLTTWNALTGVGTDLNSDPLMTAPGSGDFTLQAGSPCRNAGADLGADYALALAPGSSWPGGVVTKDQRGQGFGWEIGAYVFGQPGGNLVLLRRHR